MKITKYPQSCLIIEKDGKRLLVDPGSFASAKYQPEDFGEIEAIFLTHRHPDHLDLDFINKLLAIKQVPVVSNTDVQEMIGEVVTNVLGHGEPINIAGFTVRAHELPHVPMVDGSAGPPNTGYVFDDDFFHAGDGVDTSGLSVRTAAVPIAGPDLSLRDAHDLIESIGATIVIPVHYTIFSDEKPTFAVGLIERFTPGVELRILASGETTSL